MFQDVGLVLEGGGMRGAYTAGVLDAFHDHGINFPFVTGVSAGACNATSYVAGQRGRNYKVLVEYGSHPEYISLKRAITRKELFGMDFIFDVLPNQLVPFDFNSFFNSNIRFVAGTTDIDTGMPVYFDTFHSDKELLKIIRASSSLPFVSPSISVQGRNLMDGGIADPIPIQPSIDAGNRKHVVILTRNQGYVKKPMKFAWLFRRSFKAHPALLQAMQSRYEKYNSRVKMLEEMERNNQVYIIRPEQPLEVGRIERDKSKLDALYRQGYQEVQQKKDEIIRFASTAGEPVLS
ncbi:patatin-like phospholipase family protein [Virgibacillus senegalensis]|uniref:patatin-like phospholipase family protein n=1 Tax=Virgibacillus senegalensis TaxID=1499679 RepID=UPI00069EE2C8|nr:patatin family protein [Virgibacillus senegalensis]